MMTQFLPILGVPEVALVEVPEEAQEDQQAEAQVVAQVDLLEDWACRPETQTRRAMWRCQQARVLADPVAACRCLREAQKATT